MSLATRTQSNEQHGIAIAVETVAAPHRLGIGAKDAFAPKEGADEHEQGRARQMEVREEGVDSAKAMAGSEEKVGVAAPWCDGAVLSRHSLECPSHRGPYGHHQAASLARATDG